MPIRLLILSVIACATAAAQTDDLRVLGDMVDGVPTRELLARHLDARAKAVLAERAAHRDSLTEPEDLAAYQSEVLAFFEEQLGGFPERTPLNARVVGVLERDTFTVEKIIFESRPGFFVTGVLWLPRGDGPFPGVIVPCGHSANGKAEETYQRLCALLAVNGMAAFSYDPIGQGERSQILDETGKPLLNSTLEHTMNGVGSILLGMNTATNRVWDGIRAIDYLCSRDDIDPERIGCTGNSGGGTLTSYLMALDERIQCAAPSCYLTSFERLLETAGPQDAEQNIHGQIGQGMDHAEYAIMRAPRPTLICAATRDFFDIDGTWATYRAAKRWYTKLGYPERVSIVEVDDVHGFSKGLREGAVGWMARWLLGRDAPVREADLELFSDAELQCTEKGQVGLLDGARTVIDFNEERGRELADLRRDKKLSGDALLQAVRDTAGIRPLTEISKFEVRNIGRVESDDMTIDEVVILPADGIALPAFVFTPEGATGERVLYVHGGGKPAEFVKGGAIDMLVTAGHTVLAPDLRGLGETAPITGYKGWAEHFGETWQEFFRAYLLGDSMLGLRTEDILVCTQFLRTLEGPARFEPVRLVGIGEAAPPSLHAAVLEPSLFSGVLIEEGLESWTELVSQPTTQNQLINIVHGALRVYDLPDLTAVIQAQGLIETP